ncbi:MAG: hypothetical protein OXN17_03525 [Candidatus Poribacteria bacterium]|nr:hypothetical protein [Candidatus Poribacteria bacterium]MDE0502659.1 hypothetical protein [Candidatus Poribacteria bacterium]
MKMQVLRFILCSIIASFAGLNLAAGSVPPPGANGAHFCGNTGQQQDNRRYARTITNLDVGAPRTVRMIYFLPNDRPYRAEVVHRIKDQMLGIRTFFAEQMDAHGYGYATFHIETDPENHPIVHRVDGRHPDSYYSGDTVGTVRDEISSAFNLEANVHLIVIDNSETQINSDGRSVAGVGERKSKTGGYALVSDEFISTTAIHELGHAFGLNHDFRSNAYIMSYGLRPRRLSACSAEYLAVHPYFNPDTSIDEGESNSIIETISPRTYPRGSQSVPVHLKISDSEGLHQVHLLVDTMEPHPGAGFREVKECRGLAGDTDTVVEFNYDGINPSDRSTDLSNSANHRIRVSAVDADGNVTDATFSLTEISPYHIATLAEHLPAGFSVAFSTDGVTLATGSWDGTVKLWGVATLREIASLQVHTIGISSVA